MTRTRADYSEARKVLYWPTEKAFEALKKEYPWVFKASGVGGSGAENNNNGGSSGIDISKLSPVEQLKEARRQGAK